MADYARGDLLVEGSWLQEHLNDANLRIVDMDKSDAYRRGHIPGAVFPSDTFLKNPEDNHLVMTPPQFAAEMKKLGIDDDTLVIAYDQASNTAVRLWWVLNYYGHTNVRVLNGSWNQWLAEGRPVSLEASVHHTDKPFTPRVDESVFASAEYVMEHIGNPDVVILDARTGGEFAGTDARGNKRTGHIPGSVNLDWEHNLEKDELKRWKSADALRSHFEAAGVTPDKEIITLCQRSSRGCQQSFTLKLLGYENVRTYDGSFYEWGNRDDTPIVTA